MRKDETTTTRSRIPTNKFSKINNERVRITSKTRAVSKLQEIKRCLATNTINKKLKEANSFAKGASESRIVDALQSQKKAVVIQKTIKPAQRISIAEQKTNNSPTRKDRRIRIPGQEESKHRKPAKKRITIAKRKTNHYRMLRNKPSTIAKANCNCMPKKRKLMIAKRKAHQNCATTNTKYKANDNQNLCNTKAEQKVKHNRKTNGEMRIANRNETKMGSRISDF